MADYNQPQLDVWGAFRQGADVGGALSRQRESDQRRQDYGEAFQSGGWDALANTAGAAGDPETANTAQDNAHAIATRNATVLSNAATSLMGVPYEQRRAQLQQMAPMLEQMGIPQDQLAQFDPTDQALAEVRGLDGHFSQYASIEHGQNGEIIGVRPDGSTMVLHQGQPQVPNGYRPRADGGDGVELIPGYTPPSQGGVVLSPQAQNFLAQQYVGGQDLPSGISRGRNIGPIIERATDIAGERNMSPTDVGANRAEYQATRSSLVQLERARTMIAAFETTALSNLQVAEELSGHVSRGGAPLFNRWIQAGQRDLGGDPELSAFHTAVTTFVMEYAKIMSGATGAAGATEGAREEAMSLLNTAHTPEQFRAIVNVMRRDMHNRRTGLDGEVERLHGQLRGSDNGAETQNPAPGNVPPSGGRGVIGNLVDRAVSAGNDAAQNAAPLGEMSDEELDTLRQQLEGGGQ